MDNEELEVLREILAELRSLNEKLNVISMNVDILASR